MLLKVCWSFFFYKKILIFFADLNKIRFVSVKKEFSLYEGYEGSPCHKCKICQKPFSRKDNCKRHLYNVHGISKENFKNNIC